MADEEILIRVAADTSEFNKAINEMRQLADQFAKSSNEELVKLSGQINKLADDWESQAKSISTVATALAGLLQNASVFKDISSATTKQVKDLVKSLQSMAGQLNEETLGPSKFPERGFEEGAPLSQGKLAINLGTTDKLKGDLVEIVAQLAQGDIKAQQLGAILDQVATVVETRLLPGTKEEYTWLQKLVTAGNQILKDANRRAAAEDEARQQARTVTIARPEFEMREVPVTWVEQQKDVQLLDAAIKRADSTAQQFFNRTEQESRDLGATFRTMVEAIKLDEDIGAKQKITEINQLDAAYKKLLADIQSGDISKADQLGLQQAWKDFQRLQEISSRWLEDPNEQVRQFGQELRQDLGEARTAFVATGGTAKQFIADVRKIEQVDFKGVRKEVEAIQDPFSKFDARKVQNEVANLQRTLKAMGQSTSKEVRDTGTEIDKMGVKFVEAFEKGEMSAGETIQALRNLRTIGQETGRAVDGNFRVLSDRVENQTTPSLWKLSRAFDSVGVAGGGNILRITDALRALGPEIVAIGIALGGIIVIMNKVADAAIAMAKRLINAFKEGVMASIEFAKNMELLEAQFTRLFGNRGTARAMLDKLLELSREVGADLTGEFARVFVPRVESIDQLERMAKIMATIAADSEKTSDEIVKALKQAEAGRFRSLIDALGITQTEVDTIQDFQDKFGATEGLIRGLEDFFETTGRGWDAYEGTLGRVERQFEALKNQILNALGQPIKDAVVEFADVIGTFFDDNQELILGLAEDAGELIGGIIDHVGEIIGTITDDFDQSDVEQIKLGMEGIATAIDRLLSGLEGMVEDDLPGKVAEGLLDIAEAANKIIDTLAGIKSFYDTLKDIKDLSPIEVKIDIIPSPTEVFVQGFEKSVLGPFFSALKPENLLRAIPAVDERLEFFDELEQKGRLLAKTLEEEGDAWGLLERRRGLRLANPSVWYRDLAATWNELNEIGKRRAWIDAFGELGDTAIDLDDALSGLDAGDAVAFSEELVDAVDTITDALEKLDLQLEQRRAQIDVDFFRKQIDAEIDASRKREDAIIKRQQRLRDLDFDFINRSTEIEIAHERKIEDLQTEFNRRTIDAAQDEANKKLDIERKYQERLKEIRARFDFDAQEAIRQNDAVALLRIRRREQFELAQAKEQFNNQNQAAEDAAKEKREDIQKWLDREVEDAKLAEDRKVEDLLNSNGEKTAEIFRQYNDELDSIELWEQRKAEDNQMWYDRQLEDLETYHNERLAAIEQQYEDELAVIANAVRDGLAIVQNLLKNFSYTGLLPSLGGLLGVNLGGLTGIHPGNILLGGGAQAVTGATGPGAAPAGTPLGGGGGVKSTAEQRRISQLRNQIKQLSGLVFGGGDPRALSYIEKAWATNTIEGLQAIWDELQKKYQGAQFGRFTGPNMPVITGERNPEPFYPTQAGIIAPHIPLQMFTGQGGGGTVDNSRNMTADISLTDPSQLSPIQQTIIKALITEQMAEYGL